MNGHATGGRRSRFGFAGRATGVLGMVVGLLGAGYLVTVGVVPYLFSTGDSLAVANAPTILAWSLVIAVTAVGVGYWAWTANVWKLCGLAAALSVVSVVSLFSIGRVVVPFAVLSVIAGVLLTLERTA
ncbi:hypothetical protein [Halococcus salsus]|uniref:hypothetical protein n=1 Tax=Halococcus salsus TaxID=2162894 RepID=UPI001357882D|nr:hypothetical protein [Halococcus salsus]